MVISRAGGNPEIAMPDRLIFGGTLLRVDVDVLLHNMSRRFDTQQYDSS